MSPRSLQNVAFIALVGLGWGLNGPGSKILFAADPGTFDGLTLAVARSAWSLPLFVIGLAIAWRLAPPRLDRRRWLATLTAGVLFGIVIIVAFTVAAQYTSVAHISFLIGLSPVTNTALAALVFRTALDRRAVAALVLGVIGVALLALSRSAGSSGVIGDGLMVVWLLSFAVYACLVRYVGTQVNPLFLMALVGVVSMASILVPGLLLGQAARSRTRSTRRTSPAGSSARSCSARRSWRQRRTPPRCGGSASRPRRSAPSTPRSRSASRPRSSRTSRGPLSPSSPV